MINKIWSRQGLSAFWPGDLDVKSSARGHLAPPINAESDIVWEKMRGKQTRTRLGTRPLAYYDITGTYRYIPPGHTNKCSLWSVDFLLCQLPAVLSHSDASTQQQCYREVRAVVVFPWDGNPSNLLKYASPWCSKLINWSLSWVAVGKRLSNSWKRDVSWLRILLRRSHRVLILTQDKTWVEEGGMKTQPVR